MIIPGKVCSKKHDEQRDKNWLVESSRSMNTCITEEEKRGKDRIIKRSHLPISTIRPGQRRRSSKRGKIQGDH